MSSYAACGRTLLRHRQTDSSPNCVSTGYSWRWRSVRHIACPFFTVLAPSVSTTKGKPIYSHARTTFITVSGCGGPLNFLWSTGLSVLRSVCSWRNSYKLLRSDSYSRIQLKVLSGLLYWDENVYDYVCLLRTRYNTSHHCTACEKFSTLWYVYGFMFA
jgi:hypothetical protein